MGAQIKNYMEDFVYLLLKQHLPKIDVCHCELCQMDVAAIMLNALPPKYVVTKEGEMYTRINLLGLQYEIDALTEMTKAAKIVKAFPRHAHGQSEE